ncbi:putative Adenine phosphoribosyltransferase [Paratrimastix pyriformis]|uniref:adenine phosphoribosyltransferase n=1 Tax=Paratrimastix pyriformis TaxID=342808 RepID=A0ABQ8V1S0_9EUKA|nr:putative Adenine phosphoribosyltransferase [Paratrimastix pyriformis]
MASPLDLAHYIRSIPDFPKKGINFRDITTLLSDGPAFRECIDQLAAKLGHLGATKVVCAEARGFIFGAALAYKLGIGFVPVRKPGKLPARTISVTYALEYGTDTLHMHADALAAGERVIVLDDLLATGGTCRAILQMILMQHAIPVGVGFLIELDALGGRAKLIEGLACSPLIDSLIHYTSE